MKLFDQSEVQELVDERFASGEWWFLFGDPEAFSEIEQHFYSGEANGDFHLIVGWDLNQLDKIGEAFGPGLGAFAMAKKSRAPAAEMARFLATRTDGFSGGLNDLETGKRDCFFFWYEPESIVRKISGDAK